MSRHRVLSAAALGLLAAALAVVRLTAAGAADPVATTTPIKHLVLIVDENISFDHYFGTYPSAVNGPGEQPFTAASGTPDVDNLLPQPAGQPNLLTANPNAGQPQRIAPEDVNTILACDNKHDYVPEQKAFDGGLMDKFVENTTGGNAACHSSEVLDYFDGNTVTGLWNYAQHYAMSDAFHGAGFGPTVPGVLELASGNTSGVVNEAGQPIATDGFGVDNNTAYLNEYPYPSFDGCTATSTHHYAMSVATSGADQRRNVGDLLNAQGVTWGFFEGGFKPTTAATGATAPICAAAHPNVGGASQKDYDARQNPFAYYRSTANPNHLPPSSEDMIGRTDQANHQYDISDFNQLLADGKSLPSFSYLKAPHYEDGHAGYSDPLDEQRFLATEINAIQKSPDWASTAIVIAYDDSDGWYDHQFAAIRHPSASPEDFLSAAGTCGAPGGSTATNDRCGPGPRLPLLVISPYARANFVDHTATDQASVHRFVEDNWSLGRIGNGSLDADAAPISGLFDFSPGAALQPAVALDPASGAVSTVTPTPTPPPPVTTTTTPAATTPAVAPKPPARVVIPRLRASLGVLSCRAVREGRRVSLSCTSRARARLRTALRFRLYRYRSRRQLATTGTYARNRSARAVLRLRTAPRRGRFTLVVTVSQPGRIVTTQTLHVRL